MSVIASEIIFYKSTFSSGGVDSLGGAILTGSPLTDDLLHDLFDVVSTAEAEAGDAGEYRCVYIKNTNADPTTLTDIKFYIQTLADHAKMTIGIGLGNAVKNATENSIADESTAPSPAVSFTELTGPSNGIDIPDLNGNGDYQAVWIRRTVTADANAQAAITVVLGVQGDTT